MPVTDSGRSSLNLLRRTDKSFLGGGGRLLFAPRFPQHPDAPGIWDGMAFLNTTLEPLCTWTLLDEAGHEMALGARARSWDPAGVIVHWTASGRDGTLTVREYKTVLPDDRAVIALDVRSTGRTTRRVHLVAWTAVRQTDDTGDVRFQDVEYGDACLAWRCAYQEKGAPPLTLRTTMTMTPRARSFETRPSEGRSATPRWSTTPFCESFRHGRLASALRRAHGTADGLHFLAVHTRLTLPPGVTRTAAIRCAVAIDGEPVDRSIPRKGTHRPERQSEADWHAYTDALPAFSCSDPHLTSYYWYRWYGLRLNTVRTNTGRYRVPFVCEGIGGFRAPISYSAPCHMLENRWLHDPALAQGSLRVFLDNQREDGAFPGYIDPFHLRTEMFYHGHWGHAVRQLLLVHPSPEFAAEAYAGLARYARYFDRERDRELSGMYDIRNHYETGQEYMRRYVAVHAEADRHHWGDVFRLKGVDVTVYLYEVKRTLAWLARNLNRPEDAAIWDTQADRIREAIRSAMWDPGTGMFFDVDPATGRRTGVKAAVCFYPYMTDIVSDEHTEGLRRHLLRRREFWTPYPVPSSSADDPLFSAEPVWKGTRMSCPWNGRVWPMTNSHIAEALGTTAVRFGDTLLRRKTAEFIHSFVRMMFHDGDPRRPNCFEHYNPETGHPSVYRGVDDYQHSWVNDLIIRWVCGIRPGETTVTVDPFPFGLAQFALRNALIRGRRLSVTLRNGTVTLECDGARTTRAPLGKPIILHI